VEHVEAGLLGGLGRARVEHGLLQEEQAVDRCGRVEHWTRILDPLLHAVKLGFTGRAPRIDLRATFDFYRLSRSRANAVDQSSSSRQP